MARSNRHVSRRQVSWHVSRRLERRNNNDTCNGRKRNTQTQRAAQRERAPKPKPLLSERISRWTTSDPYALEFARAYNTGIASLWTSEQGQDGEGYIVLSRSENKLACSEVIASELSKVAVEKPVDASFMGYEDYRGGLALRKAVAEYANRHICKERAVHHENLLVSAGCGVVIENIFLALADEGDCALIPAPYYSSFDRDLGMRAGVSIECVHGTTSLAVCAFEDAYQLAMASGKTPKVCLLTNPHNPLGIVYREEDLREVLLWAMKKKLHLISDEIYVNSIYEAAVEEEFVSMMDLSLDVLGTEEEDEKGKANEYVRDYVHTVFGFSKDFCCSGLRIGCLHTENKALITAWNALGYSCAISTHTQHIFSHVLTESQSESGKDFVGDFIASNKKLLSEAASDLSHALEEAEIDYVKPAAGLFFMIDLRPMLPLVEDQKEKEKVNGFERERALWRFLSNELKVLLTPGEFCHCESPGFFRLCFAWMKDSSSNVEAVKRIAKHYRRLKHHE